MKTRKNHLPGSSLFVTRGHACSPRRLCARCSLIKVVSHRFNAFRAAFGRLPERDEPLFFDEGSPTPAPANRRQFLAQLRKAARESRVSAQAVLRLVKIQPV